MGLMDRLPPRPKCHKCGVESLTGTVHEPDCPEMTNQPRPRDWKSEHDNLAKFAEDLRKENDALKAQLADTQVQLDHCSEAYQDLGKLLSETTGK